MLLFPFLNSLMKSCAHFCFNRNHFLIGIGSVIASQIFHIPVVRVDHIIRHNKYAEIQSLRSDHDKTVLTPVITCVQCFAENRHIRTVCKCLIKQLALVVEIAKKYIFSVIQCDRIFSIELAERIIIADSDNFLPRIAFQHGILFQCLI